MRLFQLILLCLAGYIQYNLWFGHNGMQDYNRIKHAVVEHKETNAQLQKRNRVMKSDIEDLKLGLEGVEERARHELGLIKQNETFIRVLPAQDHD
ncbi:Cell division protein DivIC (FtsB), stabilizes FtsL against RasP cleavage [Pseudoalteromonas luteoviolacea B = ATCC 29581]|nr:Cell division protein DivIC (FtsB), stabilizes FtsL against RasP cleavage [Pseudoalteromonas luteoviolacea B = ATCC 29581]